MNCKVEEKDGIYLISLDGEMDTAAAIEVEKALKSVLKTEEKKDVVIDCECLEYIASSGLRILLAMQKSAMAGGYRLTLRNLNDEIMDVFKLTGFIDIFEIEE